jgi:SHS2 domain-containing protein
VLTSLARGTMKTCEQLDISGDAGLRIQGKNAQELFENAALCMFELVTDTSGITTTERKELTLSADNYETLLVLWLNELIFLFDTISFIGTAFSVQIENTSLKADISGGIMDPDIHERRLLLKAATYHNLSLTRSAGSWRATVIFDI